MEITFVFSNKVNTHTSVVVGNLEDRGFCVLAWNQQYSWDGCTPTLGDVSLVMTTPTVTDLCELLEFMVPNTWTIHRVILSQVATEYGEWVAANLNDYARYVMGLPTIPQERSLYPQVCFKTSGKR